MSQQEISLPAMETIPSERQLMELQTTQEILTSYIYISTWTYVCQRWKPSLSMCCTLCQHWINAESYTVAQLCVNTLLATKVMLITDGI
jgi:hypothetical protein